MRRTTIYGVGARCRRSSRCRSQRAASFLRTIPPARAFAVLGCKAQARAVRHRQSLGQRIRIGGERYRVIGVMEERAVLGTDLDDTAYIPTGRAMALYNRSGLLEIDVSYREGIASGEVASAIRSRLSARHGREDFTLTTREEDMLRTLSKILDILTAAVGALGGISLLVGGVGIVTIMTIAVSERTAEIGLLVALGARRSNILLLFLGEAIALAAAGGVFGLLLGGAVAAAIRLRTCPRCRYHPGSSYSAPRPARCSSASPPGCCRRGGRQAWTRSRHCARVGERLARDGTICKLVPSILWTSDGMNVPASPAPRPAGKQARKPMQMTQTETESLQQPSFETLDAVLDVSPGAILIIVEGFIVRANAYAIELLGFDDAADLIGISATCFVDPVDARHLCARIEQLPLANG